jgi:RNA polymerase sigma-70 factor, ECF subfamily
MTPSRSITRTTASTDGEAMGRVAAGEVDALGEIYDRHARSLLEFVSRMIGRADAEDIVHTVFVRAARLAGGYDGRSPSARFWLFGITRRVIQEQRRSFARTLRALLRVGDARAPDTAPPLDERADLERGLRELSEAKRMVLLLADLEGFTCDEIATLLAIPVGTVWTRLHHARRELRAFFTEAS